MLRPGIRGRLCQGVWVVEMRKANAYHISVWHGENATVFTLCRVFGPGEDGWEPVLSFRLGDVFESGGTGNRWRIQRAWNGTDPKIPYIEVEPLQGIFKGDRLKWAAESLLCKMEKVE